jgi:hypothetical protein
MSSEINPVGQSEKPPADWNVLVTLRADIPGRALTRLGETKFESEPDNPDGCFGSETDAPLPIQLVR